MCVLLFLGSARLAGPRRPRKRPGFVDVAPRSKFTYISNNSFTGRKYFPQPMCGGVAVFDYDNDGRMDIFFTNGAKLPELKKTDRLLLQLPAAAKGRRHVRGRHRESRPRRARTSTTTSASPSGDYDNDGYEDLFICSAGRNALYHNNGDGTFTDVTAASGIGGKPTDTLSVAAAWFDYDNDGLLDLVVSNYTFWTPQARPPLHDGRARITTATHAATPAFRTASTTTWATASSRT